MKAPLETKVAASSGAALLVTTVFAVLHWLAPSLRTPPDYVTGLLVTLVTLAAGYLAPHTSRIKPLTPAETVVLDRAWRNPPDLSAADRRRAENLRLTHAPGTPSFYPYPGEAVDPATPPAKETTP